MEPDGQNVRLYTDRSDSLPRLANQHTTEDRKSWRPMFTQSSHTDCKVYNTSEIFKYTGQMQQINSLGWSLEIY